MSATLPAEQPQVETARDFRMIRWLLFGVSASLSLFALVLFILAARSSSDLENADSIETIHYTESVKLAASQKLDAAKSLVQVSMLVIAVLWGLVITKKDERKILFSDRPELYGFFLANAAFVFTAVCYVIYSDRMTTVLTLGAGHYDDPKDLTILNYRDPLINNVYDRLLYIWGAAVVTAALTLYSAHGLKPHPEKEEKSCEPSSSSSASPPAVSASSS